MGLFELRIRVLRVRMHGNRVGE